MSSFDLQAAAPLIAAGATALASVVLVYFTGVLAKETKRLADATSSPQVAVSLDPCIWSLVHAVLSIKNTGTATAYDIDVSFDPALPIIRDGQKSNIDSRQLSLLKAGDKFELFLGDFDDIRGRKYSVTASWRTSPTGTKSLCAYEIDLERDYADWGVINDGPPDVALATELKRIREQLTQLIRR